MPHIVTGEIRREIFTKEGTGAKGDWKMYGVDLSEMVKDRDGNKHYANYRATFFASSPNMKAWYDEAFQQGKIISVSCEKLQVKTRETDSGVYVILEMVMPQLAFSQRGEQSQQQPSQRGGWGQPQQPSGGNQSRQQQQSKPDPSNELPMDFDDDIPF